jgi:hypothetical protein
MPFHTLLKESGFNLKGNLSPGSVLWSTECNKASSLRLDKFPILQYRIVCLAFSSQCSEQTNQFRELTVWNGDCDGFVNRLDAAIGNLRRATRSSALN